MRKLSSLFRPSSRAERSEFSPPPMVRTPTVPLAQRPSVRGQEERVGWSVSPLDVVGPDTFAKHMSPPPLARYRRLLSLPVDIVCNILADESAKLSLPTLRACAAGNTLVEYELFRDEHLAHFATSDEMAWADRQRKLFCENVSNNDVAMPRFLQGVIFNRWAGKSLEDLHQLATIEKLLTPSTACLVANLPEHKRAKAAKKIKEKRHQKVMSLFLDSKGNFRTKISFDTALTLLRWDDDRGLRLHAVSPNDWDRSLQTEPTFLMAAARIYPELVSLIGVKMINEVFLCERAHQPLPSTDDLSDDIQDDRRFKFAGIFENILIEAAHSGRSKMEYQWGLLNRISEKQQQVARAAEQRGTSTSEAALWMDEQLGPNAFQQELYAARAITIDLDFLGMAIGIGNDARAQIAKQYRAQTFSE